MTVSSINSRAPSMAFDHPRSLLTPSARTERTVGPTLSGKNIDIAAAAGRQPTTGRVLVDGKDVPAFDVRQRSWRWYRSSSLPLVHGPYENHCFACCGGGKRGAEIEISEYRRRQVLRMEPYFEPARRCNFTAPAAAPPHRDCARAGNGSRSVLLDEPLANLDYSAEELRTNCRGHF